MQAVTATARQMAEMERVFRGRAWERDRVAFEDQLFRSYGLLTNARRMGVKEFMAHWSNLRMGAAMEKLPVSADACDALLIAAQPAHVIKAAGAALNEKEQDAYRSEIIRRAIQGGA